jgi:hypothetical protein
MKAWHEGQTAFASRVGVAAVAPPEHAPIRMTTGIAAQNLATLEYERCIVMGPFFIGQD